MSELSGTMKDALAFVPDDWQPVKKGFRLGRQFVRHPLFQRTFTALRDREIIEMRGGPGAWEWRKVPDGHESSDYRAIRHEKCNDN